MTDIGSWNWTKRSWTFFPLFKPF